MANYGIRESAKNNNIKLWRIADKLGISDTAFSKKLRKELPESDRRMIMLIIKQLAQEDKEF